MKNDTVFTFGDRLTKYVHLNPTTSTIDAEGAAQLVLYIKHIFSAHRRLLYYVTKCLDFPPKLLWGEKNPVAVCSRISMISNTEVLSVREREREREIQRERERKTEVTSPFSRDWR